MTDRMRFGVFVAPFHAKVGENPTLCFQRDLDMVKELDRLGYDEVWFGEHHSASVELIASPEIFCAWVAGQTQRIKVGTGVISLPYHNPLWVADRAILLDHLTRGRFMLGIGPGVLATDADMIGLDVSKLRDYLQDDFPVLMHLLNEDEPISVETDRYKLVDARCNLDKFSDFDVALTSIFTPSGPLLAGRYGIGILQLSGLTQQSMEALPRHWEVMQQQSAKYGTTLDRNQWRIVGLMHLAETKDQAIEDCRHGLMDYFDYLQVTQGLAHYQAAGRTFEERIEWAMSTGNALIGTPEDAIEKIGQFVDASGGNLGAFLFWGHEWASPAATLRNYNLFARDVMPAFQGTTRRLHQETIFAKKKLKELNERQFAGAAEFAKAHGSDAKR